MSPAHPTANHTIPRLIAGGLIAATLALAACDKPPQAATPAAQTASPAELVKLPEHEQLMALLELAQNQRLELSQARAILRRLKHDYAADQKTAAAALAAADTELASMKEKFQAAGTARRTVTIEHDAIAYSPENYRILVAQKISARKALAERSARFNSRRNSFDEQLQIIGIKMDALAARETEVRANIGEVLRGHEATGLGQLVKNIDDTDVAAITKAVAEMQTSHRTLLDAANAATQAPAATAADLAGAADLLDAK